MKMLAAYAHSTGARGLIVLVLLGLSACSALQAPTRPVVYDFGPGATSEQPTPRMAPLPPLALAGVLATGALDSTAVLYRLAYSDAQQLRPYAQARWSMPPAELLRQRLREHLGLRRAVLNPADGVLAGGPVLTLRVELDEFSQLFDTATHSTGLLRLRATLGQPGAGGEKLVAQRSFVLQRASASPDAAGGVQALTAAADAALEDIDQWVQQTAQATPGH